MYKIDPFHYRCTGSLLNSACARRTNSWRLTEPLSSLLSVSCSTPSATSLSSVHSSQLPRLYSPTKIRSTSPSTMWLRVSRMPKKSSGELKSTSQRDIKAQIWKLTWSWTPLNFNFLKLIVSKRSRITILYASTSLYTATINIWLNRIDLLVCLQTLGVDHVATLRGPLQPAHRTRRGAGLRRQAGDAHLAAEHWNATPHQRRQETQGISLRINQMHPNTTVQCTRPRYICIASDIVVK